MGETTPVAHGGNPQDRTGSPVPKLHPCRSRKQEEVWQRLLLIGVAQNLSHEGGFSTKLLVIKPSIVNYM
ncbi:hypothetical protein [Moorena sp. SIO4G3]|uniref:hypothetical protein n=1 Tax=Moorena sp. SIO4G3 TaxID=2607821 RepID=UPI00142BFC7B|nr:hypothetical protein [Moorena sp. SIO4G3]NEO78719.1 hypothetical protein [Moorena sp. SIO4G3]